MRRRYILLAFGLMALGVLAIPLLSSLFPPPAEVTRANAYRLRKGMSMGEVETILGPRKSVISSGTVCAASWCKDELSIWVSFQADQSEAVMATVMERQPDGTARGESLFEPQPLLERVRRWLRL